MNIFLIIPFYLLYWLIYFDFSNFPTNVPFRFQIRSGYRAASGVPLERMNVGLAGCSGFTVHVTGYLPGVVPLPTQGP